MRVENNVINRVVSEGNSKVKSETLQGEIQSKPRGPLSQAMVDADIERIVYRRSGRAAATVTARTVDLPNGRVDVVFTINEGEKTGVKAINFVGNHAFSDGKLRDLMQTTEMNLFSFLKTSDVYDPDRCLGSGAYPAVLSQEWLCRFPRRRLRRPARCRSTGQC
jgi:outer membrane protein insertion porin family